MSQPEDSQNRKKVKVDPRELALKYKRLTEEFNKCKRENVILKRAVLQEQQNSKTLSEALKEKEMRVRVVEQENDQLTYHNDRLTKRVVFLQEVAEKNESKAASWFAFGKEDVNTQVKLLVEELERKNKENMGLHQEIFSIKQEHQQTLNVLQKKMDKIKFDSKAKEQENDDKMKQLQNEATLATKEKDDIKDSLKFLSQDLTLAQYLLEERKKEIIDVEVKHRLEEKKNKNVINRHIIFDDTSNPDLNTLNLPSYDKGVQSKLIDILSEGVECVRELFLSVSSEHKLQAERLKLLKKTRDIEGPLNAIYDTTIQLSAQYDSHLEPLLLQLTALANQQSITTPTTTQPTGESAVSSTLPWKKTLLDLFNNLLLFYQSLVANQITRYQEECNQKDTVIETQKWNQLLTESVQTSQRAMEKLVVSVSLICDEEQILSKKKFIGVLRHIQESLNTLKSSKKDYCEVLTQKIDAEQLDPFILPKLKLTNQNYLLAIKKSAQILETLTTTARGYVDVLANPPPSKPVRGVQPSNTTSCYYLDEILLRQTNENMLNLSNKAFPADSPPLSIPYQQQLDNQILIQSLNLQNSQLDQTLKTVEDERNQFREQLFKLQEELSRCKDTVAAKTSQFSVVMGELFEARNLLQVMKQAHGDKQTQQSEDPETGLESSQGDTNSNVLASNSPLPTASTSSTPKWTLAVIDDSGNQRNTLGVTEIDEERETKLKLFYDQRCSQLENQIRLADSKAMDLSERKDQLEKQLKLVKDERDEIKFKLSQVNSRVFRSQEDLESTTNSYKEQLAALSDHVIELNEKLSSVTEELETIKKYKIRCGKCKTWNTIEWLLTEGKNGRYCSKGPHPSSFNFA